MRVSVREAAEMLGMSPQCLRIALRMEKFPFGVAVKGSERRWTYYVNKVQLEMYLRGENFNTCNTSNVSHVSVD